MSVISTPGDTVTTTVATGLAPDGVAAAPSGADKKNKNIIS